MSGFRSTTNYTYNNHSIEFDRNYIALKCIVKYIILIKNYYAHTIKALVICNLLMVNYYKINTYTYNLQTLMSAIIPPT